MYQNYFRWLETNDEYFPYAQYPAQGRWMIYGLGLPDDVLEKVYHRNAERLFATFKEKPNNQEKRGNEVPRVSLCSPVPLVVKIFSP